ncbi:MAG: hypothetical protein WD874_00780 [Parcubacteria group bacterium]
MPHISKRGLKMKQLEELQLELVRSFERSFDNHKTRQVFNEFFSRTERVMFAKRLAVIAMLSKGVSSHMIAEALLMSPSTTERMSVNYEKGRYTRIIKEALGKKDIWELIEKILFIGGIMPPKVGGKRWRSLDKSIYKEKLKNS